MTARHYLDHNATAPARAEVIDVVAAAMRAVGNASSVHAEGRAARGLVETAREALRALVNAPVNGVIFTSGGTEAIHYALHGLSGAGAIRRIFVSAIEHAATLDNAASTGLPVEIIPARGDGLVDLAAFAARLEYYDATRNGAFLACLMLANNETGAIQNVAEAAEIAHRAGGLLFVDAAQAVGKIPVNFVMSGADLMALTAHKFGGPVGVGALIVSPNLPLAPIFRGGGQEMNRRAGTTNIAGIAGLGVAARLAQENLARGAILARLRDRMQAAAEAAGAVIWAKDVARLPGTLSLSAPGFLSSTQLMTMDLAGLAVSAGSACSSGKTKPSHVLKAMGADDTLATTALRVSLGWNSTEDDADAFIREWPKAYAHIKTRAA